MRRGVSPPNVIDVVTILDFAPKMILGHMGLIRPAEMEDIGRGLGLAEGIETALTVSQRIGWGPMWAAPCAADIALFSWIPKTTLNIFADNEPAGIKFAQACAERWGQVRSEVLIHLPPTSQDWNDAAKRLAA